MELAVGFSFSAAWRLELLEEQEEELFRLSPLSWEESLLFVPRDCSQRAQWRWVADPSTRPGDPPKKNYVGKIALRQRSSNWLR
jgi:hypothetical protein